MVSKMPTFWVSRSREGLWIEFTTSGTGLRVPIAYAYFVGDVHIKCADISKEYVSFINLCEHFTLYKPTRHIERGPRHNLEPTHAGAAKPGGVLNGLRDLV